jgi:hypothetical protein
MKGGTADIQIRGNLFLNAGQRAINLGGATGLQFFRPAVGDYEATRIEVAGNRFVGSEAPVAFATAKGGWIHHNTFYLPGKWVMRILQEQPAPPFVRCGEGIFEANLIVFDQRVSTFVNVGPNTRPETFVFRANAWYDLSGKRQPKLPTPESDGIYQVNPELEDAGKPTMHATSQDPRLAKVGAEAYQPTEPPAKPVPPTWFCPGPLPLIRPGPGH